MNFERIWLSIFGLDDALSQVDIINPHFMIFF